MLNTSPNVGDLREAMSTIYSSIYVDHVVKHPLYSPGEPFKYVAAGAYHACMHACPACMPCHVNCMLWLSTPPPPLSHSLRAVAIPSYDAFTSVLNKFVQGLNI